jgi:hypothetical protein
MCYWICAALLIVVLVSSISAEEYYIAADGKAENDGSNDNPWQSVEYALSKVGGGNTIIVTPGIYRGPIQIARQYAGTAEAPTIIKSEVKWKAIIIGAPYHVISNGDGCDWVVIDGFEAMGGRYDGIKMNVSAQKRWDSLCSKGKHLSFLPIKLPPMIQHQSFEST